MVFGPVFSPPWGAQIKAPPRIIWDHTPEIAAEAYDKAGSSSHQVVQTTQPRGAKIKSSEAAGLGLTRYMVAKMASSASTELSESTHEGPLPQPVGQKAGDAPVVAAEAYEEAGKSRHQVDADMKPRG